MNTGKIMNNESLDKLLESAISFHKISSTIEYQLCYMHIRSLLFNIDLNVIFPGWGDNFPYDSQDRIPTESIQLKQCSHHSHQTIILYQR